MNWRIFVFGITLTGSFGFVLIELYMQRYANTDANFGAGTLIFVMIALAFVSVFIASEKKKTEDVVITPANCPGHDWQLYKYSDSQEQCVICAAVRGRAKPVLNAETQKVYTDTELLALYDTGWKDCERKKGFVYLINKMAFAAYDTGFRDCIDQTHSVGKVYSDDEKLQRIKDVYSSLVKTAP